MANLGILDGIGEQVDDDLLYAIFISHYGPIEGVRLYDCELYLFLSGFKPKDTYAVFKHPGDLGIRLVEDQ